MKIFRTDQERVSRLTDPKISKSLKVVQDDGQVLRVLSRRMKVFRHSAEAAVGEQVLTNADQQVNLPRKS